MIVRFGDSFYFLAPGYPSDPAHERARAIARDDPGRIVTTAWVVTEVADALTGDRHFEQAGSRALLRGG